MKKKISLKFYSRGNLGDDLFVKIFCDYFKEYTIILLANPLYVPRDLGRNVKTHPMSIISSIIGKLQSYTFFSTNRKLSDSLKKMHDFCEKKVTKNTDAIVYIGGSIFMDKRTEEKKIDFRSETPPSFQWNSSSKNNGKNFIIGANLGPVYSERYWHNIKRRLNEYKHVCLRDYSSYSMVKDLPHVQYAPDVIFMLPRLFTTIEKENVIISIVDISKHTSNEKIIASYYEKLKAIIEHFQEKELPVTLVSFCKREGDEVAISVLLGMLENKKNISTYYYVNDWKKVLELFEKSTFVIGSRFHSVILALLYNKPVFPISYNCKTEHYLLDLNFSGKYANLESLPNILLEDILYNYENQVIVDCTEHKKYAENQFKALKLHLKNIT